MRVVDILRKNQRHLFNIYVDEFHEFFTRDLIHMLAAARKYNVGLTIANRHPEQVGPGSLTSIMGNVGNYVILSQALSGAEALSSLTQPRFSAQDLMALPDFEAVVKITSGSQFIPPQRVVLLPPPKILDPKRHWELRQKSAQCHGQDRAVVEKMLLERVERVRS